MTIGMLVLALLLGAAVDGKAEGDSDGTNRAKASALIKMGVEFRRKGDQVEALRQFHMADELAPSGHTLVQIGLAEQSLQRWVAAEEHLSRGLQQPDEWVAKFRDHIQTALTAVRGHLGELEITGPAGAMVSVAGVARGTLPLGAMVVGEGLVDIGIRAPGAPEWATKVKVKAGTRTTVVSTAPSMASGSGIPACQKGDLEKSQEASPGWRWRGLVGGGLLGSGLVTMALGTFGMAKHHDCAETSGCSFVYDSLAPGAVLLGVGAAAVLGGVLVLYTGGGSDGSKVALGATPWGLFTRGQF